MAYLRASELNPSWQAKQKYGKRCDMFCMHVLNCIVCLLSCSQIARADCLLSCQIRSSADEKAFWFYLHF